MGASKISNAIIGTFTGECADANITNKNGLDITREVWEHVFASDDYKQAIELGWYIGFLGHPEDPGCMDFEHAAIVMTEGHIDANGKVYGTFNLIDTPVGQVIKKFIDAGVQFGISVRGAGDIVGNSVDPETFVFRGFDIVTFPAFPESIPTFQQIAASTDLESQGKYKAVCECVKRNLDSINSATELKILQSQFAKQSNEYKMITDKLEKVSESINSNDISKQRVEAMTNLYLAEKERADRLEAKMQKVQAASIENAKHYRRKMSAMKRIMSSQLTDTSNQVVHKNKQINALKESNLTYKQDISASSKLISDKDAMIEDLQNKLSETVAKLKSVKASVSNLETQNSELNAQLKKSNVLASEYQKAYTNMYCNAVGIDKSSVKINSNMSVGELDKIIGSASPSKNQETSLDVLSVEALDDDTLVTL